MLVRHALVHGVGGRLKRLPWLRHRLAPPLTPPQRFRLLLQSLGGSFLKFGQVLALQPDGIFLSNGPGDPEPCDYAIDAIREYLGTGIPLFGICLGHQLLSLASGARTMKMKFGHHGANHPVQDLESGVVMITSQNHGFAVDDDSLPDNLVPTHRSLFDDSLQGVTRSDCPAFSFQGHPEASPGPHDVAPLFDRFIGMIKATQ